VIRRLPYILAILALFAVSAAAAQDSVTLEPFTESIMRIESVRPQGWTLLGGGLYRPGDADPSDPTLLAIQAVPATVDDVVMALLPQVGLTEVPEPVDQVTIGSLNWTVYQTDVEMPQGTLRVDWAVAPLDESRTVALALFAPAQTYDVLHETVFLPVLQATRPLAEAEGTAEPVPYLQEEVRFPGGAEDVMLAGTLTLPEGEGPFPAVILMTGSGPQDRDESLEPLTALKPFAVLADVLTRAGVAVLRYDDRGVGESTGSHADAVIADFTADGGAAIDFLLTREDIDRERIGILGHSEGGIYAATLAARRGEVAFVVGMAPAVAPGLDLMIEQNVSIVRSSGASEAEQEITRAFAAEVLPLAIEGDLETAEALARQVYSDLYDRQPAEVQQSLGDRDSFVDISVGTLIESYRSDWFISLLESDPTADWRQVSDIPVLAIFGGLDVQVLADQNADALEAALRDAGNPNFTIITIPEANHLFQQAISGSITEYSSLPAEMMPELLTAIVEWVTVQAGVVE